VTRRVLVVDDEQAMLHTVRRILSDQYEVACARSPAEALEMLPAFKPDLAIVDIRMPDMDGFELMARLKILRPDLDLIVMTGSVTEADAKLIRAIREKAFYFIQKPFDREVLRTLVARCFELRRLTDANRRHVSRLEAELEEARAFQKSLLPAEEARVEGIAVCARYVPCSELGGDFFDYAAAGKGRATVLVADVSGHGAAAAMLTGIVKAAFHSALPDAYEPRAVVERIAGGIRTLPYNMMVTAICARIASREPAVEYVNAGHPPAILCGSSRSPFLLGPTGSIISPALPDARWEQKKLPLQRTDRILLYTDGVVEAPGEHEELGLERLTGMVRAHERGGPALLAHLLAALRDHLGGRPSVDDVTLLEAAFESDPR